MDLPTFKTFIGEAKTKKETLPSAVGGIGLYAGKPKHFVRFSNRLEYKLAAFGHISDTVSSGETPRGWYAWSLEKNHFGHKYLKELEFFKKEKKRGNNPTFYFGDIFPYGGDRRYAHVFKLKPNARVLYLDKKSKPIQKNALEPIAKTIAKTILNVVKLPDVRKELPKNFDPTGGNKLLEGKLERLERAYTDSPFETYTVSSFDEDFRVGLPVFTERSVLDACIKNPAGVVDFALEWLGLFLNTVQKEAKGTTSIFDIPDDFGLKILKPKLEKFIVNGANSLGLEFVGSDDFDWNRLSDTSNYFKLFAGIHLLQVCSIYASASPEVKDSAWVNSSGFSTYDDIYANSLFKMKKSKFATRKSAVVKQMTVVSNLAKKAKLPNSKHFQGFAFDMRQPLSDAMQAEKGSLSKEEILANTILKSISGVKNEAGLYKAVLRMESKDVIAMNDSEQWMYFVTEIFKALGYDAIFDGDAEEMFDSEPHQIVFLHIDAFEPVGIFDTTLDDVLFYDDKQDFGELPKRDFEEEEDDGHGW